MDFSIKIFIFTMLFLIISFGIHLYIFNERQRCIKELRKKIKNNRQIFKKMMKDTEN